MRLAVFDVDGTISDSQAMIVASLTHAFTEEGIAPPPRGGMLAAVGLSLENLMRRLAPDLPETRIVRLSERYRRIFWTFRERGEHPENLFEGARGLLDTLRGQGVVLGIATGKSVRGVDHLLARNGMADWFATIQTSDHHPSKPDPSMVLTAMAETGAAAHETIMIGDATFDMAMALSAGAGAIGVTWGNHPGDHLAQAGAHTVVSDFNALAKALDALWQDRAA